MKAATTDTKGNKMSAIKSRRAVIEDTLHVYVGRKNSDLSGLDEEIKKALRAGKRVTLQDGTKVRHVTVPIRSNGDFVWDKNFKRVKCVVNEVRVDANRESTCERIYTKWVNYENV